MSSVPDWHGELLAPYIAADESVQTAYVEDPPDGDSRRSKTTVATDSRLIRLSVEESGTTVTSLPYSQVSGATAEVVDGEERDFESLVMGAVFWIQGLGGVALLPAVEGTLPGLLVLVVLLVALGAGMAYVYTALQTEGDEVHLELEGVDGDTAYSTTMPTDQVGFAESVSRFVGDTHRNS